MYATTFPLAAWLICIVTFISILSGALMLLAAAQEDRDPDGAPKRVRRLRNGGVRLILAGVIILIGYAAWRLF